mmetsp:Transcript_7330/g.18184  ORF Transcript_7330/g.18184 Transcript_7330/m.18184 type:complete len:481 (+) Transcript_7330:322-1764(+)
MSCQTSHSLGAAGMGVRGPPYSSTAYPLTISVQTVALPWHEWEVSTDHPTMAGRWLFFMGLFMRLSLKGHALVLDAVAIAAQLAPVGLLVGVRAAVRAQGLARVPVVGLNQGRCAALAVLSAAARAAGVVVGVAGLTVGGAVGLQLGRGERQNAVVLAGVVQVAVLVDPVAAALVVQEVEAEELDAGRQVHALGGGVGGAGALQDAAVLLALEGLGAGGAVADVGQRTDGVAVVAPVALAAVQGDIVVAAHALRVATVGVLPAAAAARLLLPLAVQEHLLVGAVNQVAAGVALRLARTTVVTVAGFQAGAIRLRVAGVLVRLGGGGARGQHAHGVVNVLRLNAGASEAAALVLGGHALAGGLAGARVGLAVLTADGGDLLPAVIAGVVRPALASVVDLDVNALGLAGVAVGDAVLTAHGVVNLSADIAGVARASAGSTNVNYGLLSTSIQVVASIQVVTLLVRQRRARALLQVGHVLAVA